MNVMSVFMDVAAGMIKWMLYLQSCLWIRLILSSFFPSKASTHRYLKISSNVLVMC